MARTLADLDAMTIEEAHALSVTDRDQILDLIIDAGRNQATGETSHRIGLYSDYFEEDLVRMLKVKAVKVYVRGTTPSDFSGNIIGDTDAEQYRAAFRHVKTILDSSGTSFSRVVTFVIFLTNMDNWSMLNEIYKEFIPIPPCRAVIGTTGLAQKPLAIEIVNCIAYRVAP